MVRVEVKNKFNVGDIIEVVSPEGTYEIPVEKIYKTFLNHANKKAGTTYTDQNYHFSLEKSEETQSAHGGGYEVWIPLEKNP